LGSEDGLKRAVIGAEIDLLGFREGSVRFVTAYDFLLIYHRRAMCFVEQDADAKRDDCSLAAQELLDLNQFLACLCLLDALVIDVRSRKSRPSSLAAVAFCSIYKSKYLADDKTCENVTVYRKSDMTALLALADHLSGLNNVAKSKATALPAPISAKASPFLALLGVTPTYLSLLHFLSGGFPQTPPPITPTLLLSLSTPTSQ